MSALMQRFRQQPYWIALIIFVLLTLWVASGSLGAQERVAAAKHTQAPLAKVVTQQMFADSVERQVTLYGRTEPDRVANLRSELQGQVLRVLVEEGEVVRKGQQLVLIDSNDLELQLAAAKATLAQRNIELEGARQLGKKGYQSKVTLAQAEANVAMAQAQIKQLELSIENTVITAPFAGVVNERSVEVGDLLREGDQIATVVDLDPLVITADVTEAYIQQLNVGQLTHGRLVSEQTVTGKIRYISAVSNEGTNTFPIEVAVANPNGELKAGMSTELMIPFGSVDAIKVTPAVLALDELGNLGVKTVEQSHVVFVPIDIVQSDSEGVWLAGLGQAANIITLGHGYVRSGDEVVVVDNTQEQQAN